MNTRSIERPAHNKRKVFALTILFVVLAAIAYCAMPGCEQVKSAIGYPTDAEVNAARQKLTAAESKVESANAEITKLRSAVDDAAKAQAAAEERKDQIRQLYAQAAQQLATLKGAAADALVAAMMQLQSQLTAAGGDAKAAAETVATMNRRVAEMEGTMAKAKAEIAETEQSLDQMAERADTSIASAVGFVKSASTTAQNLGVPGAQAIGDQVGNGLHSLLTLALGGSAIATWRSSRKRKQQSETAQAEADDAQRKVDLLTKVVQTNERLGLIKDDPQAKADARNLLGEEAVKLLRTIKAEVIT